MTIKLWILMVSVYPDCYNQSHYCTNQSSCPKDKDKRGPSPVYSRSVEVGQYSSC